MPPPETPLTVLLQPMPPALKPPADMAQRLQGAHPAVAVRAAASPEAFAGAVADADGAIGFPGPAVLDALAAMNGTGRLRWLQSPAAGADRIPLDRIPAGVTLTAGKGPMAIPIAEHAIALCLALARLLPGFLRDQQTRRWSRTAPDRVGMVELHGKTMLVLGVGAIGAEVARIARHGFAMRVLGFARSRLDNPNVDEYVDRAGLHAALAQADFVCVCLALTPDTRHILDAAALAVMKPTAFLVNIARGEVVDESALTSALREGRIAGAGLDVFEQEPLPAESPLWDLPNVIVTPHTAPVGDRVWDHIIDFWSENIRRFAEGQSLLGLVDRQAGY